MNTRIVLLAALAAGCGSAASSPDGGGGPTDCATCILGWWLDTGASCQPTCAVRNYPECAAADCETMDATKYDPSLSLPLLSTVHSPSMRSFTLVLGPGNDTYSLGPDCTVKTKQGSTMYMCSQTALTSSTSRQTRADAALSTALDSATQGPLGSEHHY